MIFVVITVVAVAAAAAVFVRVRYCCCYCNWHNENREAKNVHEIPKQTEILLDILMSWSFILYTNTSHDMRCIGEMREFYPKNM